MPGIRIDRLTLKLSGSDTHGAERLARLVAERLAVSDVPGVRGRIDAIRLHVSDSGEDAGEMANRIVEGLLRELTRSS
jgi:hypothetical protein